MIVRKFSVWTFRGCRQKVIKFAIDDSTSHLEERPTLAEFHVSQVYPEDVQRARANEYCSYMNRIAEATRNAYSENLLEDKLKGVV